MLNGIAWNEEVVITSLGKAVDSKEDFQVPLKCAGAGLFSR
jgi:hypothetical protein